MCTYATTTTELDASAKGPRDRWFHVTQATVYFDHPVHARAEHTLNVDLADPAGGPSARIGLELTADSARRHAEAITSMLASVPGDLVGQGGPAPA